MVKVCLNFDIPFLSDIKLRCGYEIHFSVRLNGALFYFYQSGGSVDMKKAVKTGDTTNLIPLVILLVAALGCIIGILAYRKRK